MSREERARLLRPLGDARGQILLEALSKKGELCTHELAEYTNIPQSSVSYHMKILCDSGLVKRRRDGKWTYFRLCPIGTEALREELMYILHWGEQHQNIKK